MVENLVVALRADIATLTWMSEPTRQQALAKLSAMSLKIGYPDKWRDYSSYQVLRGSYLENIDAPASRSSFTAASRKSASPWIAPNGT